MSPDSGPALIVTFYSWRDGVGRTTTMAHLARVLAAEGRKVLLVETGHSDRGFRAHLGLAGQTADRRWDQALRGSVTPVRVAGRADEGRIDLLELRDGPQDRPGALRAHLSAAGYDHVLVDSPSGDSPGARACTLVLPDIVAVCFTRGPWEPGESVDVVQDILRRAPGHVRVVPAVMMADPAAGPQPDLRSRLAPPLDGRVLPDVEVPYQARRRSGPAPVSAVARFRLDAYERLAVVITGDAAVRARSVAPARLLVVRSWRDRLWAEWIRGQLLSAGREARDVALTDFAADVPPDVHVLVVVSASTHGPAEELLRLIEARRAAAAPKEDLGMSVVYVESVELPAGLTGLPEIDISTAETDFAAYEPLRRRLSLNRVAPSPSGARFPGRPVVRWLPARNPGFVGRDPILESLRDLLLERRHVVVGGATGLGKSQLALELAHRYAGAYDVVAWLPAENAQVLRAALGALAVHAEVPTGRDAVVALLAQVNSGDKRWLLIYDNADVPAELDGLLPGARDTCHVVITSQSDGWGALPRVETTVFDEAESVELVTDRVPAVTADDARRVARLTARIPLVVELSAAWIAAEAARQGGRNLLDRTAAERAVTAFIARFSELSAELASRVATVEHAAVVALATEAVRDHGGGAAAVWLLRACSLLSADGISLRLLHTSPITACLRAVDERLGDSFMIDPILRAITTYRLAQVGFEERSVFVMHRLVQQMVRSAMTIEELAVLRAELQRALAACTPTDMEVDHGWHRTVFAELADHLVPSGALESEEPSVRDWVVNQLRYFWQQGDKSAWERARDLGERAERLWRATPGVEPGLRLRLLIQLANVYRDLGEHAKAAHAGRVALDGQRADPELGPAHPRTLITAAGHAANLRALGRFESAYVEDAATLGGVRELLGDDHFLSRYALNNLALSALLFGDPLEAYRLEEENYQRLTRLLSEGHPDVWWSAVSLARYHRELGRIRPAKALLQRAIDHLKAIDVDTGDIRRKQVAVPRWSLARLRAENSLTVIDRFGAGRATVPGRRRQILESYRAYQGDRHQGTLSCALSLAADLHAAGEHTQAVRQGREALAEYERVFSPGHPFAAICRVNLAVYLADDGDLAESRRMGAEGLASLRARLGPLHPYTLAAVLNHASTLVRLGKLDEALDLDEASHEGHCDVFGEDQPPARAALANLRDTRRRIRFRDGAETAEGGVWSSADTRRHIDLEMPEI